MKRWLAKILMALLLSTTALVLLLAVAKLVLLDRGEPVPGVSTVRFNLDTVRALARSEQQSLPLAINLVEITEGLLPRAIVIAGGGWGSHTLAFSTIQVVYSTSSVIIDPLHSRDIQASAYPSAPFREERYSEMQEALRNSDLVLATHEHLDHVGGIAPLLPEIRSRVRLTAEQIESLAADSAASALFPPEVLQSFEPLRYDHYFAVRPGMVLIKAPGHTRGLQMIYVMLRSGEEFLLASDIAWHMDNVTRLVAHPYATNMMLGEDGKALADQLRLLHDIDREGTIHVVLSHDGEQHAHYFAEKLLGERFTRLSLSRAQ